MGQGPDFGRAGCILEATQAFDSLHPEESVSSTTVEVSETLAVPETSVAGEIPEQQSVGDGEGTNQAEPSSVQADEVPMPPAPPAPPAPPSAESQSATSEGKEE